MQTIKRKDCRNFKSNHKPKDKNKNINKKLKFVKEEYKLYKR